MDSPTASSRPWSASVRIVCALLVATSAAYFWGTNVADEDLWNHLNLGELVLGTGAVPHLDTWSYSAFGRPWVDHEWGADVVFALLFRTAGTAGFFALKFLLGFVVLGAIADAARTLGRAEGHARGAHPGTSAAVLVVVLAAVAPGASFRPQLFTMACLAVEWMLLERADRRLLARDGTIGWELPLVPAVVLIWANTHGGFPVGVGLHALFVVAVLARSLLARRGGEPTPSAGPLVAVAASGIGGLAATLVNPYGLELHGYLTATLGAHDRIAEWLPVPLVSWSHAPFKVLVVATIGLKGPWLASRRPRSARCDWRAAFLMLAAAYAFRHQRHSVLFAIAAAPVLMVAGETLRRRLLGRWPALAPRGPVAAVLAAGALAVAGVQLASVTGRYVRSGLTIPYERSEFPADAVEFLRAHGVRGNMAVKFEWGGYTLHHLGDDARVFIDGRYEAAYPQSVIDDYFTFIDGAPGWTRVLDAYPTDVVMVDRTAAIVPRLEARPDLVHVYTDATAVVYLTRATAERAALDAPITVARRAPGLQPETVFP